MIEKYFTTRKTARVYYNTDKYEGVKYLWFALHGYGQLGRFFARNFDKLDSEKHLVVVPEAQSRFYLEGVYGRVGATWMTKEDRTTDIQDYLGYLDDLYSELMKVIDTDVKVIVFGFSQGAATASRWANSGSVNADHLVLWSSIFPPDLEMEGQIRNLNLQSWLVVGNTDEYLTDDRLVENEAIMAKMGVKPKVIHFDGGHKIGSKELVKLSDRITGA